MNEQVIAPGEAWEAVERLKIGVDYNRLSGKWCATIYETNTWIAKLGWGATPLEAVANLLERIGETVTTQVEVANA